MVGVLQGGSVGTGHYEAVRFCSSFRRMPESMCFAFVFYFLIGSRQ